MLQKKYIRKFFLRLRKNLSEKEINCYSEMILEVLKKTNILSYQSYHIFLPIIENKEVNTKYIIEYLYQENKKIYIPKILNDNLISIKWEKDLLLKKGKWNIVEPFYNDNQYNISFEIIFVPMIVSDKFGNRVGYGKGFYDRFLQEQSFAKKVGLCLFDALDDEIETHSNDIKLDYLVTPCRMVSFSPKEVK